MRRHSMAATGLLCLLLAGLPLISTSTQAATDDVAERLADCQDDEIVRDERQWLCAQIISDTALSEKVRAGALVSRGIAYLEDHQLDLAMTDFERAVNLDPANPVAYAYRGEVHKARGELEKALGDYDRAITLDAASADLYANRGEIRLKLGAAKAANADFEAALRIERGHPVAATGIKALAKK